ncbi:MAG: CDP-alcohol phosphatidyltransferase family protein [Planctomycetota bacterium]
MSNDPPDYEPTARRPINSRDTRWASLIADWLASTSLSANGISIIGMLAACFAGISFYGTSLTDGWLQRSLWLTGGVLCQVRLLCNLFDGMVAIRRNAASAVGELYNEVPDRVSDVAVLVGLGFAAGGEPVAGLFASTTAVFVAYVRAMAVSIGAPNDFSGPLAKPQRMALVTLVAVWMTCSPATWQADFDWARWTLWLIAIGCLITALRRLRHAAIFLKKQKAK